jgi:hypothetical protein
MGRYDYEYHHTEPEMSWGPFFIVMTLTSYVACVLAALCVATGLFYLAELAEEFPTLTRRVLKILMGTVAVLMLLFMVVDGLCWWRCCFTIVAHLLYGSLLSSFPYVKLLSVNCIGSFGAFILDNVSWYVFFISQGGHYPFWAVMSFLLLCVWSTPIGFFISLAATDDQLPQGGFAEGRAAGGSKNKRRNISAVLGSIADGSFWTDK